MVDYPPPELSFQRRARTLQEHSDNTAYPRGVPQPWGRRQCLPFLGHHLDHPAIYVDLCKTVKGNVGNKKANIDKRWRKQPPNYVQCKTAGITKSKHYP